MKWNSTLLDHLQWSDTIINQEAKQKVAQQISDKVKTGDIIGAGSGSTVYLALFAIAKRIKKEGLAVQVIPASLEIAMTCENLQIPVTSLLTDRPNWCFDGADEVDPDRSLIKGRGGALFKEKLLIRSGSKTYILVDETKLVNKLGTNFPVPIEIFPGSLTYVESALKEMNVIDIALRLAKGKDGPVITENGNFLLDVKFVDIKANHEQQIKSITGVIESGLFIDYDVEILIAK
ncbi:ribose 5-phosphate isomerase A [Mucilaginibacter sp. OK098]|uniref:ribose 5-phosphate isomerase A n=1 Tax=Mucilaginibacter sp. OK098 TaxID=1855297 RepID=UPI00091D318E|nr:ribose 5-phosphate isomerase A [Mucilaginibacter sp. OK098]SHL93651.1 ribose-5-phosphate isomerase [Mucilaginibacter sp. OK098]